MKLVPIKGELNEVYRSIYQYIQNVRLANYFQKKEGHLYLKLFYLYVYSVSAVVGNEIQFCIIFSHICNLISMLTPSSAYKESAVQ
jgi:hypothetical protein